MTTVPSAATVAKYGSGLTTLAAAVAVVVFLASYQGSWKPLLVGTVFGAAALATGVQLYYSSGRLPAP